MDWTEQKMLSKSSPVTYIWMHSVHAEVLAHALVVFLQLRAHHLGVGINDIGLRVVEIVISKKQSQSVKKMLCRVKIF